MTENPFLLENPRSRMQLPMIWLQTIALAFGLAALLQQNAATDFWQHAPWLFTGVALWAVLATRYLSQLPSWERNSTLYRMAEIVLLAVVVRLFIWTFATGFPSTEEWQQAFVNIGLILGLEFWGYLVLTLFVWQWANGLTTLFLSMEVSSYEVRYFRMTARERDEKMLSAPALKHRSHMLQSYFSVWLIGGVLLVIFVSGTTVALREMDGAFQYQSLTRLPLPPLALFAVLVYFFAGLWLLSYARYTALFARWLNQGITPQRRIASRWRRMSTLLLVAIGGLAALLPIGSTTLIVRLITAFYQGVAWVVSLLLAWIASLFPNSPPPEELEALGEPLEIQPIDQAQFELAGSAPRELVSPEVVGALTWAFIALLVIVALYFVLRGRGNDAAFGGLREFWVRLRAWFASLWDEVSERIDEVRGAIDERLGRDPDAARTRAAARRRQRLADMTPREQVRYYYLQAVKRAASRGVVRQPDQTPAEFLESLQGEWPEAAEDSEQLTEAFLEARYSPADVEKGAVDTIKDTWKRVRGGLRGRRKA